MNRILNWVRDRLSEKTTLAALTGLIGLLLQRINIPEDIIPYLVSLIMAALVSFAVTKG